MKAHAAAQFAVGKQQQLVLARAELPSRCCTLICTRGIALCARRGCKDATKMLAVKKLIYWFGLVPI